MLDIIKQKKNLLIVIIIIVIIIIYLVLTRYTEDENDDIQNNILDISENMTEETEENNFIIVHITGAVNKPGIVKLQEGGRIEDAIEAVGGLTEDSDISDVNLAYILEDGIKIRIPTIDDEKTGNYITEDSGQGVILSEDSLSENSMVNINKADETELQTLSGIGPSLASKIVEYRTKHGKFSKIEDIKNVTGIGDSKFESIKDSICVK